MQSLVAGTVITATSAPDGSVTGRQLTMMIDSAAFAAAAAKADIELLKSTAQPTDQRDLSSDEVAAVRSLGAWLWERRCGRG